MQRTVLQTVVLGALATMCVAQNIVPPQDCASTSVLDGCPEPPPPTPSITGQGTLGLIPVFTGPTSLGDSVINQSSTGAIGIGGPALPNARLGVTGSMAATGDISATGKISAGNMAATGDIAATGKVSAGNVSATNDVTAPNIKASSQVSASQYNIGPDRVLAAPGSNSYMGIGAGQNSTGTNNSFFGHNAGMNSSGGNSVTLLGADTTASVSIHHATAVGSLASAVQSNTLILGGVADTPGQVNVGLGTNTPHSRLHIVGGDVYLSSGGRGIIMKTVTGQNCARLKVNDLGQVSAQIIPCP